MSCEEPKFGVASRYEIVNVNSYDPTTLQPTVQAVVVDSSKPLFQNNDMKYNDRAFQAYMKYDDMKFNDLEDYLIVLAEIEKEFEFRVFTQTNPTEFSPRVNMVLGNLRVSRGVSNRHFCSWNRVNLELEDFKMIFDTFKELLAAYCDMVGDKGSIIRRNGDDTLYNKPLEEYINSFRPPSDPLYQPNPKTHRMSYSEYIGREVQRNVENHKNDVWVEKNGIKVKVQSEISKAIMQAAKEKDIKSRRKYELGSVDICDDVYNQVVEWIESRKDFIYVDYNNMKQY